MEDHVNESHKNIEHVKNYDKIFANYFVKKNSVLARLADECIRYKTERD